MVSETRCVFVTTNNDTRLGLLLDRDDSVSVFKDKICKEHEHCFPSFGKISISALKVKWGDQSYHLPDSMILSQAFHSFSNNASFLLSVDVIPVDDKADELLTRTAASSKPDPTLQIHEPGEKSKKRKLKTSASANKSYKKPALGKGEVEAFATGPIGKELVDDVNESHKDEYVSKEYLPSDEMYQTTDAENQGVIVRTDATSEAMQNETEIGTKDIGEKATEEVNSVKTKKKTKTKKAKAPAKEDHGQVAFISQNVEPVVVVKDPLENLDKLVKKIVEEA